MKFNARLCPQSYRFGGTALLTTTTAMVVALTGCTSPHKSAQEPAVTSTPDPTVAEQPALNIKSALCEDKEVKCGKIPVPGTGLVEYALLGEKASSKGLVLVEPGGPGTDTFSITTIAAMGLPAKLENYTVLLIRELRTSRPVPGACGPALQRLGAAISTGETTSPGIRSQGCGLEPWDSERYGKAVRAISAELKKPLIGVVGHSFGALPATAAASVFPKAWLILSAPIAPPGTAGAAVISGRVRSLEAALNRSYASWCEARKAKCAKTGVEVATEAASRVGEVRVPHRSQAIRSGDINAAVLGASYDLDTNAQWLWPALEGLPKVDDETWQRFGRMSDQLLERYGLGQHSVGLAGYVAGVCHAYSGWQVRGIPANAGPAAFLLTLANECQQGYAGHVWALSRPTTARACLVINNWDPVTPVGWGEMWHRLMPKAEIDRQSYNGHLALSRAEPPSRENSCVNRLLS